MKPRVMVPDIERLVRALLEQLMDEQGEDVTVAVGVPEAWKPSDTPHLQIAWDGTPTSEMPVVVRGTVRIIARARSTSEAKRLAALAEGLLVAHGGGAGITGIHALAGVLPARDPDTQAELASVSLRVTVRTIPIPVGS